MLPPPDDVSFLKAAHGIYVQHSKFPEALALAIRLGDPDLIREDFNTPGNPCGPSSFLPCTPTDKLNSHYRLMKRQLAFLLARAGVPIEYLSAPVESSDAEEEEEEELPEDLLECLSNSKLSSHFREFGKEVGVGDAKGLEDVYKSHLENTREQFPSNGYSEVLIYF